MKVSVPRALLLAPLLMVGCSRQDTEGLGRLAAKLVERTAENTAEIRGRFNVDWTAGASPDLAQRVKQRLRWENTLSELPIDVESRGTEVVLTGSISTLLQRQRILELAETTTGVERVTDQLTVRDP